MERSHLALLLAALTVGACGRIGYEPLASEQQSPRADAAADAVGDALAGLQDSFDVGFDSAKPDDTKPDAAREMPSCSARKKLWFANFAMDPTKDDRNSDGAPDWSPARGAYNVNQLKGGSWEPSATTALLDSNPQDPFSTRTIMTVSMQNFGLTLPQTSELGGAIAWMNLDNDKPTFLAVYLRLVLTAPGKQTLFVKSNAVTTPLATFELDDSFQLLTFAVDPKTNRAELWIEQTLMGEWTVPRGPKVNQNDAFDAFATFGTFFGKSRFASIRLEQCAD